MKISIIVPVYNSHALLQPLMDSLFAQTYKNWELVLVDDGSKDDSYNNIKKMSKEYNNVIALHQNNQGPGIARKKGCSNASGDLFFFIDSDDWISNNNVLQKITDIFSTNDVEALFFNREEVRYDETKEIKTFQKIKEGEHSIFEIDEKIRPGMGTIIFKKSLIKDNMFISTTIYEDLYANYLYLDGIKKFYYSDEVYYSINRKGNNSNSLTSTINCKTLNGLKVSTDVLLSIYHSVKLDCLKKSIAKYMINNYLIYKRFIFKMKSIRKDKELRKKMDELLDIIRTTKVEYEPENNKLIKKILFYLLVTIKRR